MGELSPWHWIIVLLLFALLFGSKRLPDAARGLGRSLRIFKAEMRSAGEEAPPPPVPADEIPVDAVPADTVPVDAVPPEPKPISPVLQQLAVTDQVPLATDH